MCKWADHEGIDGRNSVSRKIFETCAKKFNDPSFKPFSNMCFDIHDDFLVSHDLFETEEQSLPLVAPDNIKEKLATVRVKARINRICYISNLAFILHPGN